MQSQKSFQASIKHNTWLDSRKFDIEFRKETTKKNLPESQKKWKKVFNEIIKSCKKKLPRSINDFMLQLKTFMQPHKMIRKFLQFVRMENFCFDL